MRIIPPRAKEDAGTAQPPNGLYSLCLKAKESYASLAFGAEEGNIVFDHEARRKSPPSVPGELAYKGMDRLISVATPPPPPPTTQHKLVNAAMLSLPISNLSQRTLHDSQDGFTRLTASGKSCCGPFQLSCTPYLNALSVPKTARDD